MPSIAVHLTLSYRAAEEMGITSLPDFFLGSIAPDAVNLNGFAPQKARYDAHIRSKDPEVWKRRIADMRQNIPQTLLQRPDFLTGFLLHLYTDISWDELVQPGLFGYLRQLGFAEDELNTRKWDELRGFDSVLSKQREYKSAVEELKKAAPAAVTTVTPELLSAWRDKITALEYPYAPSEYLCDRHIEIAKARALELYRSAF